MVDYYPYLIPSLPMLHFGMKPPFSFERFLEICRQFIPKPDYQLLCTLPRPQQYSEESKRYKTVRKWIEFDTAMKNELVKVRAQRKHIEPSPYLRPGISSDLSLAAAAMAAMSNPSLLDAETVLEEIRWKSLEEIATGHHFDLDLLITYAYKLLILIRLENIHNAHPATMLEHILPNT